MMALTFTLQENLLPGDTVAEKWAHAEQLGFAGIELRGGAGMSDRLPELRAARAAGVPMQSICIMTRDFIGGFTPEQRQAAHAVMRELLDVAGEIGWAGMKPVTDEGIVKAAPDVVLVMSDGLSSVGGVDGLLETLPAVASTPAGESRRIIDMADSTVLSFGPQTADVLDALAVALYAPARQ